MSVSSRNRYNAKRKLETAARKMAEAEEFLREKNAPTGRSLPRDLQTLVDATRFAIGFEGLCDKLGKPPTTVRKLIALARESGINLQVGNNHVQLSPQEQVAAAFGFVTLNPPFWRSSLKSSSEPLT